jgi:hypothetical protein
MGGSCRTHGTDKKLMPNSGRKIRREEATRKTQAQADFTKRGCEIVDCIRLGIWNEPLRPKGGAFLDQMGDY